MHFHQGEYLLATRMARLAEEAHRRLSPLLDHQPRERTQLVVSDDTDFANGSATPLYFNAVRANAAPPDARSTLADFDDWAWELLSHEYTHILHLDTVGGLPEVANQIFGKLWITNGAQPSWFIEGIAVISESDVSSAGRIRASQESMLVRTELLSNTFPRIDQLSNPLLQFPRGNIPYTIGARFLSWVDAEYGAGALRDLSHDYGSRFIPLALNLSAERVLGQSWISLFDQYKASELSLARSVVATVRAGGETRPELLTRLGELVASPRFSPDGTHLFYSSTGPDRLPELRVVPLGPCCDLGKKFPGQTTTGDKRVGTGYGELRLAVAPDESLVYSRSEVFQEFATVEDLFRLDASGNETRLTRGVRASEPDVAQDGAIAFVQRLPGGRTAISVLEPGAGGPRVVFEDPEGRPVGAPRFSPDGQLLAFIHHGKASWRLRLVGRDGAGLSDLVTDRSLVRDPAFSSDGRFVLFSSDRTGIYDIYAVRLTDRALVRATRVVTGAFEPALSPDGTQLAYVQFGPRGYNLARIPIDLSTLPPAGPSLAEAERPAPFEPPAEELYPVRPYEALSTALPKWWLPFAGGDALGSTLGAFSSGGDVVGRHDWSATAWLGTGSKLLGWDLRYTSHLLYPDLTFAFTRDLAVPAGLPYNAERQVGGFVQATIPWSSYTRAFLLSLAYELTHLAAHLDPFAKAPPDGVLAAGVLGFSYSDARRFPRSISSETGQRFSATFRLADAALGSRFSFWQLSSAYTRYLVLPWTWNDRPLHHALALRLSVGAARGDFSRRHRFSLGGFDLGDPLRAVLTPTNASTRVLRGFKSGAFVGEEYALGSLEYRFPLLDVQAGAWTLPIYLRRLHFAVFADAGDAFTLAQKDFELNVGAGAELRAEVVLGWYLPTDTRLGCARGLTSSPAAITDCYFALGGVF